MKNPILKRISVENYAVLREITQITVEEISKVCKDYNILSSGRGESGESLFIVAHIDEKLLRAAGYSKRTPIKAWQEVNYVIRSNYNGGSYELTFRSSEIQDITNRFIVWEDTENIAPVDFNERGEPIYGLETISDYVNESNDKPREINARHKIGLYCLGGEIKEYMFEGADVNTLTKVAEAVKNKETVGLDDAVRYYSQFVSLPSINEESKYDHLRSLFLEMVEDIGFLENIKDGKQRYWPIPLINFTCEEYFHSTVEGKLRYRNIIAQPKEINPISDEGGLAIIIQSIDEMFT